MPYRDMRGLGISGEAMVHEQGLIEAQMTRRMAWGQRAEAVAHMLLVMGSLALAVATFLPLFHPLWPLASVAEHFAFQVLAGALIFAVLALALRRWRWLAAIIAIALIQIWIIHPYWPSLKFAAAAAPQETRLKIVSLNVWYRGTGYQSVRDYLRESDADVIGLVEVTPRWKAELAPLLALYPYSVDCIDADERCEEMLFSRHPFISSAAGRVDGKLPVLAWGEIALPDRKPVTIAVTHLVWPLMTAGPGDLATDSNRSSLPEGLPRLAQAEQAANLATGIRALGDDLILMGDFNAAPWSDIQQHLRGATGLDNQGFAAPSWPAWSWTPLRLPIDHILTRGSPQMLSFTTGPDVGSDHLPVEAVVAVSQP